MDFEFTFDESDVVTDTELLAEKEALTKTPEGTQAPETIVNETPEEKKLREEAEAKKAGAVSEEELAKEKAALAQAAPEVKTEPVTTTETNQEADKVAAVQGYANFLKEAGVFGDKVKVEDIKSTEDLIKAQVAEMEEWKNDYLNQLPPVIKQLAESWEEGVPLNDLINIKSNQIKYATITDEKLEENVNLQKDIYRAYLKEYTKYSDKKINDTVDKAVEDLTLEDLVKSEALPELKKHEVEKEQELVKITKRQQEEARIENETRLNHYKETINKTEEVIPGIKVTKAEKDEIYKNLTVPVAKDGYGNPVTLNQAVYLKDPAKFDAFVTYMVMKTKGLEDFSFITNTATTKATKKLEEEFLNKAPRKSTGAGVAGLQEQNFLDVISRTLQK